MSDKWTLHHGDTLLWLPTLPAESVDMLLTDPPYSSGGMFRGDRSAASTVDKYVRTETQEKRQFAEFHGDSRDQRSLLVWMSIWLAECWRVLKPGGVVAVFTDWRQLPLATDAVQAGGFSWRGIIAWDKTDAARTVAPGYPRHQCEFAVWGSKGPLPQRPAGTGLAFPGCLRFPTERDRSHPTGKPVGLMAELVKLCDPDSIILDPFAGSGTTGVAAIRSGRRFLGCELSPEYHQIARDRLAAEEQEQDLAAARSGQMPLLGLALTTPSRLSLTPLPRSSRSARRALWSAWRVATQTGRIRPENVRSLAIVISRVAYPPNSKCFAAAESDSFNAWITSPQTSGSLAYSCTVMVFFFAAGLAVFLVVFLAAMSVSPTPQAPGP